MAVDQRLERAQLTGERALDEIVVRLLEVEHGN
jgi:hypothetical protein